MPQNEEFAHVFEKLVRDVLSLTGADAASIFVREGDVLRPVATAGEIADQQRDVPLAAEKDSLAAETYKEIAPHIVRDTAAQPDKAGYEVNLRSEIGVPLILDGEIFGVLSVSSKSEDRFDTSDMERVSGIVSRTLAPHQGATPPITFFIDPGTASKTEIADLLSEISSLYSMIGGSGISFSVTDVRSPEVAQ